MLTGLKTDHSLLESTDNQYFFFTKNDPKLLLQGKGLKSLKTLSEAEYIPPTPPSPPKGMSGSGSPACVLKIK